MDETLAIYHRVLGVTNYFLRNAKQATFEELKEFDPDAKETARSLRLLASILKELASDSYEDQNMALNVFQCCLLMERIADSIIDDDETAVQQQLSELEMHINVP